MPPISELFDHSLSLLTDLYQLTMAYGYWKLGWPDREAVFHLTFRDNPFRGGYAIAAGLEYAVEYLNRLSFTQADVDYLAALVGNDERPLFSPGFLDYLRNLRLTCDIDAVEEGTAVFPHEPIVRVRGPVLQCQLLETPLLTLINFQTLIATKSARICDAAGNDSVLEFGLRRAQGMDGGIAASRAAFIGGCAATSNLLAGRLFGIPVRGTHAHSWVMCFDDEISAFGAYAEALPNNCVFLVDTYDTLQGVRHAADIGKKLRAAGHEMIGVRLDSGDLAYLSIEARKILDAAGFPNAAVLASNDLDERLIQSLKTQGAQIAIWGVGTRLVTAQDQPALGGVYKLGAIRDGNGQWQPKIKLSEQLAKISVPGILQTRRFFGGQSFQGDCIYDELTGLPDEVTIVDPQDVTRRKVLGDAKNGADLLTPIFRGGKCVYAPPPLAECRKRTRSQLAGLHASIRRFDNPHRYPVGLEKTLHDRRLELILKARGMA